MNNRVDALAQQALAHQHAGRIDMALNMFSDVLDMDPNHPQANFTMGIAAYQSGNIGAAIAHLEKAAKKVKKNPIVHQLLGLALLNTNDHAAAIESLRKAASLAPDNADILAQLGDAYRTSRKAAISRATYERALAVDPENGYALVGLGQLEISIGNIDEGKIFFHKAIEAGKELPSAFYRLALAEKPDQRPQELDQIESLIKANAQPHPKDLATLHWAAGKIYEDIGAAKDSAAHNQKARDLTYTPFDMGAYRARLELMKEVFTRDFFEQRKDQATLSDRPIFIFGLPRSGTTLVEQIYARHPMVASGGEITTFRDYQDQLGLKRGFAQGSQGRLRGLSPKDFKRFASGYQRDLDAIDKRTKRVTDKMPHNYEMLWLMALLFPKATFVHCVRNPADTCMSLLSHALSPAHNYARRPSEVAEYYRIYADLMAHWHKVLPVEIRDQSYEGLVYDQETESRALIDFAGLDWDPACLEFYKGETPVTTFSDTQVRRPIFTSSIGRWKMHKDTMPELFDKLGPLAPDASNDDPRDYAIYETGKQG
ncbi:Flp pilus assembly protein TadD [Roseibium hamelinense]|uniref:Flp pilus assembly protein TadD n=1 Tax=Roseibium hamelinense TaxID=150831 RepID=A0A562SZB2_9HYPH|nr:sulfotransferase [Roseibium hamelinense]MTI43648.1 sulfotransferase family protein [Roseibium hamelinense]TWI86166.1 Flp pilus assembly protein TadD [Roseibium hamelinense]